MGVWGACPQEIYKSRGGILGYFTVLLQIKLSPPAQENFQIQSFEILDYFCCANVDKIK